MTTTMEIIEKQTPSALIQLMLKQTAKMLETNEEFGRNLERHEEILEALDKRETLRLRREQEADAALGRIMDWMWR